CNFSSTSFNTFFVIKLHKPEIATKLCATYIALDPGGKKQFQWVRLRLGGGQDTKRASKSKYSMGIHDTECRWVQMRILPEV
ncbi:hypothetical protein L9F63_024981, partial [Diploptera punctata]